VVSDFFLFSFYLPFPGLGSILSPLSSLFPPYFRSSFEGIVSGEARMLAPAGWVFFGFSYPGLSSLFCPRFFVPSSLLKSISVSLFSCLELFVIQLSRSLRVPMLPNLSSFF